MKVFNLAEELEKERKKNKELQKRIDKALKLLKDWDYLDKIDCFYEPKEVIDILKGNNK